MTNTEIRNTLKCINLMVADLNDVHNNFDVPESEENAMRYELLDSIELFNDSQTTWNVSLVNTRKGWCLKYE